MAAAYEKFLHRVMSAKNVKIYGAGKLARTLYYLFIKKGIYVDAFVVTDVEQNPVQLCGRPVMELNSDNLKDNCSLVVGLEKRETVNEVLNILLEKKAENIIMVPLDAINDIYCNFVIDENSVENFCAELSEEKRVIVYVTDADGEMIAQYLQAKHVQIGAVCVEGKELLCGTESRVISFEQLSDEDKDSAIVLTMGPPNWQRGFINKLRESGFEKIILMSADIKEKIKEDYKKAIWEGDGASFQAIDTLNVEIGHYIVQKTSPSGTYRWRLAVWDEYPYGRKMLDKIKSGKIMEEYDSQYFGGAYVPYVEAPLIEVQNPGINLEVYMAKFHKDKKIEAVPLPNWIIPIQGGKALTDIRIADITDDTGDNISEKNVDYSEGTALYWIWKNTWGQDYVGLFHYRRQMAMGKDSLQKLIQYDVMLTVPTYISTRISTFFCKHFILEFDWKLMMHSIKEFDDSYYQTAIRYAESHCYFPCNIFIMRRKYFDEMCTFIFGVLEKVDGYYRNIRMIREDRYLGFLVENLLSVYLMHNIGKLKIVYTDMKYYYPLKEN